MRIASLRLDALRPHWPELRLRLGLGLAPGCVQSDCPHRSLWRRVRRPRRVRFEGAWYCAEDCLERALREALGRLSALNRKPRPPHRVPLGLLLLSRQQLTAEQLRAALDAQRFAGRGRIGEWAQTLGFVDEMQVTAALARQWSCPVWRSSTPSSLSEGPAGVLPQIPLRLLESFAMLPVAYVRPTATLHMAFAHGIDYEALYSVECMVGCRTAPCLALPSFLERSLEALAESRSEREILFHRVDPTEFAAIVRSYAASVEATQVSLASCGEHWWARLERAAGGPLDLLLYHPRSASLQNTPELPRTS